MAAFYPWLHITLLKSDGPQPAVLPTLKDDSNEFEAILRINKHGKYAKVKYIGYNSSYNKKMLDFITLSHILAYNFETVHILIDIWIYSILFGKFRKKALN